MFLSVVFRFQLKYISFLVVCSGMISKGFGFVAKGPILDVYDDDD